MHGATHFDNCVQILNHHANQAFHFVFTHQKYEFFVKVQDFDARGNKGLSYVASEDVNQITEAATFELYIIRDDLEANPIAENAARLREQAEVCDITFGTFDTASDADGWISSVVNSVGTSCDFTLCSHLDCESIRPINEDGDPYGDIEGYHYCDCDVVIGLDDNDLVFLFTVEDKGSEELPSANDIKLIGLFESLPSDGTLDSDKEIAGLPPINSPVFPTEVPRFTTLQVCIHCLNSLFTTNSTPIPIALCLICLFQKHLGSC